MIIDTEVHLLHPDAENRKFACGKQEIMREKIYEHADFHLLQGKLGYDGLEKSMTESRIDGAVIMGMPWRDHGILRDNNAYIGDCVRRNSEQLRGLFIPDISDPKIAVRQIEELDSAVFKGVKLVPSWQGRTIDDPMLKPVLRQIEEKGLFLMVHTDHMTQSGTADTPSRLFAIAQKHRKLKILAPHLGGLLCLYALLPQIKEIIENVYFITSVSATMKMVEFAAQVIPDRLMFGSDYPFNHCHDQKSVVDGLQKLSLPENCLRKIQSETAATLFDFKRTEGMVQS